MIGVIEVIIYVEVVGFNLLSVFDLILGGVVGSWLFVNLILCVFKDDFFLGFFIKYFIKDMGIVILEVK